jgi:hypothetical protein
MSEIYNFYDYDLTVITFDKVFERIQLKLIDSLTQTPSENNYNIFNADCKRFLLHYLIKESCDCMRQITPRNKILLVDPSYQTNNYEIWEYFDRAVVIKFIQSSLKTLKDNFPFPIYIIDEPINLNDKSGELMDTLYLLMEKQSNHHIRPFHMQKLKQFSKRNGLKFLTNSYYISSEFKKLFY